MGNDDVKPVLEMSNEEMDALRREYEERYNQYHEEELAAQATLRVARGEARVEAEKRLRIAQRNGRAMLGYQVQLFRYRYIYPWNVEHDRTNKPDEAPADAERDK